MTAIIHLVCSLSLVAVVTATARSMTMMSSKYLGKSPVFIAGGSNGVGLEVVKQLSSMGTPVHVLARREVSSHHSFLSRLSNWYESVVSIEHWNNAASIVSWLTACDDRVYAISLIMIGLDRMISVSLHIFELIASNSLYELLTIPVIIIVPVSLYHFNGARERETFWDWYPLPCKPITIWIFYLSLILNYN